MSPSVKGVSQQEVQLKVLEAYTRDVGRAVARLDYDAMDSLNASTGDVIEIKGKRRTVAKCLPLYPSDEGRGIGRIDGLIRNNAGVAVSIVIQAFIAKYPRPEDAKKHLTEAIVTYEHFQEAAKKVRSSRESNPKKNVAVPYYR